MAMFTTFEEYLATLPAPIKEWLYTLRVDLVVGVCFLLFFVAGCCLECHYDRQQKYASEHDEDNEESREIDALYSRQTSSTFTQDEEVGDETGTLTPRDENANGTQNVELLNVYASEDGFLKRMEERLADDLKEKYDTFPANVYSNALLATLNPVETRAVPRFCRALCACLCMLLVWTGQLVLTTAVYNDAIEKDSQWWRFLVEDVWLKSSIAGKAEVATRITKSSSDRICGTYTKVLTEDSQYFRYISEGSSWNEIPTSWTFSDGLIQEIIQELTLLESFNMKSFTFVVAMLAWTALIFKEMGAATSLTWSMIRLPRRVSVTETFRWEENIKKYVLHGLPYSVKMHAVVVFALRMSLAVCLFGVGCTFLRSSLCVIDVILNAVALGFVLDLDILLFVGLAGLFSNQILLDKIVVQKPRPAMRACEFVKRHLRPKKARILWADIVLWKGCGAVLITLLAVLLTWGSYFATFKPLREKFDACALTCLWLGPTPIEANCRDGLCDSPSAYPLVFPVPGFCESLSSIVFDSHGVPRNESFDDSIGSMRVRNHYDANPVTYVKELRFFCDSMTQLWTAGRPNEAGKRMVDEDLPKEDAANVWCNASSLPLAPIPNDGLAIFAAFAYMARKLPLFGGFSLDFKPFHKLQEVGLGGSDFTRLREAWETKLQQNYSMCRSPLDRGWPRGLFDGNETKDYYFKYRRTTFL